jgi:type VI secretion system protein ImpA
MDSLKAPIPGEAAFGVYLKGDRAAYRALRNAFNGGQSAYRALSETTESLLDRDLQVADQAAWERLADEAGQVLRERSKDIEIFVWFIAAQMHQPKAISNTAAALEALTDLVESHWDDLQPILSAGKLGADGEADHKNGIDATKLRIFLQLIGEVPRSGLLHLPLTNTPLFQEVSYGQMTIAEKDGTLDTLRATLLGCVASDRDNVTTLITDLQDFLSHAIRLDTALRPIAARCNEAPVPISNLTKELEDILRLLKLLSEGTGLIWPVQPTEADHETTPKPPTAAQPEAAANQSDTPAAPAEFPLPHGAPANRELALDAIAELARFFRATEPQSPVHLMLDRALRWGRMSIVELYAELLEEGSESFNKLSLVSGLESFEHSGRSGRPAPATRAGLPKLASYENALSGNRSASAPIEDRPDPAPLPVQDAPDPAVAAVPAPTEESPEPNNQDISGVPEDLAIRSFEW